MTGAALDEPTVAASALVYATAFGWRVAPVRPESKVPSISEWQKAATTDRSKIRGWFDAQPNAGVCIVTGRESGLWVLDVDVADGKQGMESLRALVNEHGGGTLPATLVARTPSGGLHYYWSYPEDREIRNSAGNRLGPGLDVRGEGGQVNAPPTSRAQGSYRWAEGRSLHGTSVLPAPDWLVDIVAEKPATPASELRPAAVAQFLVDRANQGDDSFKLAEAYNVAHPWVELLVNDGWTLFGTDRNGDVHWTRPGKDTREGSSATVYADIGCLHVFTSSVDGLPSARTYDQYGYMTFRDYGGDFTAAGRALRPSGPSMAVAYDLLNDPPPADEAKEPPTGEPEDPKDGPTTDEAEDDRTRIEQAEMPLNSAGFWTTENDDSDFLIAPFIALGRAHALYAEAKAGKSYVVLQALAAASVPGHDSWVETPEEPISVLYLDYEMTENDLRERLGIFGYDQDDDFSHLHYVKASMLGADLDTLQGGLDLLRQAQKWECQLVVVDTMSRAVSGDENDADTIRRFYQHTGRLLKAHGIAWLRIDHAGKAKDKGQRGSSAKNDDVDIVWKLERTDKGAAIHASHSRVFWIPSKIELETVMDPYGAVTHVRSTSAGFASGTSEAARQWIEKGLPIDLSRAKVREAGIEFDNRNFADLRRFVKAQMERSADCRPPADRADRADR